MGWIDLIVNGEKHKTKEGSSIGDLLRSLKVGLKTVVIEYNGKMVERRHLDKQLLESGDRLEVVRFVAGG